MNLYQAQALLMALTAETGKDTPTTPGRVGRENGTGALTDARLWHEARMLEMESRTRAMEAELALAQTALLSEFRNDPPNRKQRRAMNRAKRRRG